MKRFKFKNYFFIIFMSMVFLSGNDISSAFRFIYNIEDAYISAAGSSDTAIGGTSSLFNNISAAALSKKEVEIAFGFTKNNILDSTFSSQGLVLLPRGFLGYNFHHFGFGLTLPGYDYNIIYQAMSSSLSYSFLVSNFLKNLEIPLLLGYGVNYLTETILDHRETALAINSGFTLFFLKERFFITGYCNNLGLTKVKPPLVIGSGLKLILPIRNIFSMSFSGCYELSELIYHSFSTGTALSFLSKYTILLGYQKDIFQHFDYSLNTISVGTQVKILNFEITTAYIPFSTYKNGVDINIKYFYNYLHSRLPDNQIGDLPLQKLITESRKALRHKDWTYAEDLLTEGLFKYPGNDKLLTLFGKAKKRKQI